jgi:hypothetical protein
MAFASIAGDGSFHQLLVDALNARGTLTFLSESYHRALFQPHANPPPIAEGVSGRHLKELRRKRSRLFEAGRVECVALEAGGDVDGWIREFLQLELRGWKGQQGSAFASQAKQADFFAAAVREAFANRSLMMLALRLNGEAIAMKCNFLSGCGSFAFKIAFDERYSLYSPGVLLEMDNMNRLRERPDIQWMDSCAVADHFMINRLWTSRRNIQTILASTGKPAADFLISVLPLLRWFRRKLKASKRAV